MSEEMAVSDNPSGEEAVVNGAEALVASAEDAAPEAPEPPSASSDPEREETQPIKTEPESSYEDPEPPEEPEDDKRGIKRRASAAFSNTAEEDFKGFAKMELDDSIGNYQRVLENLEAEVAAVSKTVVPLRTVMGTPTAPPRASKRSRRDTDGSRPSSALSSRSEGEGGVSSTEVTSSPAVRGRRATTEMSSPLLRVPLERGWKRELVYRAALDQHSRRNADIYYYTPQGKKLRSTREVAENLSGTGLTVENFSFFKEPLGVDDPEKEIIRDAKLMRRVESPVAQAAAPAEGKRTPKPKPPKGASPEPTPRSPPAKIKVKSMQPRLSRAPAAAPPGRKPAAPDNNNTHAAKKNRTAPPPASAPAPASAPTPATSAPTPVTPAPTPVTPATPAPVAAPPPLQSRPPVAPVEAKSEQDDLTSPPRQLVQPCSMTCGRGVPTLACGACLCLYHPACAGRPPAATGTFYCKNCRKSSSPASPPPPLTPAAAGAGGAAAAGAGAAATVPAPRRVPAPPAPRPPAVPDKRVTLRMKMAGGPDGARVWAVAPAPARGALPQSLALLNGRRFIVVPRALVHSAP